MKKTVLTFGLIAGAINAVWVIIFALLGTEVIIDKGELLGYSAIIISSSLIFVAIKTYRDRYCEGFITFGQAFKVGILVSLIASLIYVLIWMVEYYYFIPDFWEQFGNHMVEKLRSSGATEAEMEKQRQTFLSYAEFYRNPLANFAMTFCEVFPVGLVITLISALILKRNPSAIESKPTTV